MKKLNSYYDRALFAKHESKSNTKESASHAFDVDSELFELDYRELAYADILDDYARFIER